MKKTYSLVFAVIFTFNVSAQDYTDVRLFEVEFGFGLNQGWAQGTPSNRGGQFILEVRANMHDSPFSVGTQVSIGFFDMNNMPINNREYYHKINYNANTAHADFNHREWKRISLLGGIGVGYAQITNNYSPKIPSSSERSYSTTEYFPVLIPRIGAEFFHRLRLTLDYKIMVKNSSCFSLTIGIVLGGGLKK
jgi:opacity protein-like surface antigen